MREAAAEERFEDAARYRNRLHAIERLSERQAVERPAAGSFDVIGIAVSPERAAVQVFPLREGRMVDRYSFHLENAAGEELGEVLEQFCLEYYGVAPSIPQQIVVPRGAGDTAALEGFLTERRGSRVEVRAPERGEKRRLQELAQQNAQLALDSETFVAETKRARRLESLEELREALNLESLPIRIECFDISNIQGQEIVGSMVVFEDAVAKRSHYRKFTVRGLDGQDDFGAMREVISRRFSRLGADVGVGRVERVVRGDAEPRRDRRRQGPALGRARGDAGARPAARRGDRAREADRGGVRPRPQRADPAARASRRRCSCCSASATRRTASRSRSTASGATSRRARRCSTSSTASGLCAGARCCSTSARPSAWSRRRRRSSKACPACRRRRRAASTRSCTGRGAHSSGRSGPSAAWRVIRSRNFAPYFVGNAASASGTWFQNLAASILVFRLTHSPFLLGVLNFCQFVPVLVLSPWAGGLADRLDRRKLLLVDPADVDGAHRGARRRWRGAGRDRVGGDRLLGRARRRQRAVDPGQQSLIAALVDEEDVPQAVALNSMTFNLARAIGPASAAGVIATLGHPVGVRAQLGVVPAARRRAAARAPARGASARERSSLRDSFGCCATTRARRWRCWS